MDSSGGGLSNKSGFSDIVTCKISRMVKSSFEAQDHDCI